LKRSWWPALKQDSEESSDFIVENMGLTYRQLPEMRREINFFGDRRAYLKIREIIREFKPDIVHTHAAKPGTVGRLAAIHEKVPVIVHTFHGHVFHSYFGKLKTRVFLEIEKYLAKRSSAIIAISEKQKNELVSQYHVCEAEKVHVVPLGFDLGRFREQVDEKRRAFRKQYHIAEDEIAVGIIGRLVPVKNHAFFLHAMKDLVQQSDRKIKWIVNWRRGVQGTIDCP
jgi:glycosyltransferase involved in cell wall biosynthesis